MLAHPANQGGDYSVDLVEQLTISPHQWEVALVEMIFSQDWNPIIPLDLWVTFCVNSATGGEWVKCSAEHAPRSAAGMNISTIDKMWAKVLKPLIKKAAARAEVTLSELDLVRDGKTNSVSLRVKAETKTKKSVRLEFSSSLYQMLGFRPDQLVESRYFQTDQRSEIKSENSHFAANISRGVSSLWIYTDIIANQITGDSLSPLLRVIQVDPKIESNVSRVVEFQRPHFCALQAGNIQTIRVNIRNAYGLETIQFATPVVCKLMFRRKQNSGV